MGGWAWYGLAALLVKEEAFRPLTRHVIAGRMHQMDYTLVRREPKYGESPSPINSSGARIDWRIFRIFISR